MTVLMIIITGIYRVLLHGTTALYKKQYNKCINKDTNNGKTVGPWQSVIELESLEMFLENLR